MIIIAYGFGFDFFALNPTIDHLKATKQHRKAEKVVFERFIHNAVRVQCVDDEGSGAVGRVCRTSTIGVYEHS